MIDKFKKVLKNRHYRCALNIEISYEEAKKKMSQGAILVDVRSVQEYNEGHLYDSINLADFNIQSKHNIVLPNKNSTIILYCQNGGRSKRACKKLMKLGYTNVYNLRGGLDNLN